MGLSFAGLGLFIYGLNEVTRMLVPSLALMAAGATKVSAYAFGFSHTIIIAIVILAVALIGAVAFARIMAKRNQSPNKA